MSLYNGPARGGNRGGKDQFNWESVKSDKDREFYLGHSVKATTGRWQKGKDVFWYTREKPQEEQEKERLEKEAIKQREEDLMNEAMGLKPKSLKQTKKPKLDQQDMAKLLGRTESDEQGQPDPLQDPDAVKGLGYAPNMMTGGASAGHDVLQGIGVDEAPSAAGNGNADVLPGPPPKLSLAELQRMQKEQEKIAKKAHKAHKKAIKKEAKKAKKQKRKHADMAPSTVIDHAASLGQRDSKFEGEAPSKRRRSFTPEAEAEAAQTTKAGAHDRDKRTDYPQHSSHRQRSRSPVSEGDTHRRTNSGRQQVSPDKHARRYRENGDNDDDRQYGNGDRQYRDDDRHYRKNDRRHADTDDRQRDDRHYGDRHDDRHHSSRRRHDSPSLSPPRRRH